jgi:hypothetical protein
MSNPVPGTLWSLGDELRKPVGRLFFAGTETAVEWAGKTRIDSFFGLLSTHRGLCCEGYMEGALQAGEYAAAQVASALQSAGGPVAAAAAALVSSVQKQTDQYLHARDEEAARYLKAARTRRVRVVLGVAGAAVAVAAVAVRLLWW